MDNNEAKNSGYSSADAEEQKNKETLSSKQENIEPHIAKTFPKYFVGYGITLFAGIVMGGFFEMRVLARDITAKGLVSPEFVQLKLNEQQLTLQRNREKAQKVAYVWYAQEIFERNGIIAVPVEGNTDDEKELAHSTWLRLLQKDTGRPVMGKLNNQNIPLAWQASLPKDNNYFGDADHTNQKLDSNIQLPKNLESIIAIAQVFEAEVDLQNRYDNQDEILPEERNQYILPKINIPKLHNLDIH